MVRAREVLLPLPIFPRQIRIVALKYYIYMINENPLVDS